MWACHIKYLFIRTSSLDLQSYLNSFGLNPNGIEYASKTRMLNLPLTSSLLNKRCQGLNHNRREKLQIET